MSLWTWKVRPVWQSISILLAMVAFTLLSPKHAAPYVSARSVDMFGPACGAAVLDGNVNAGEWSTASTQTFQMVSGGIADPLTATLYVMNSGYYLYLGMVIDDDEFSPVATYLPRGDAFRLDFDNDHSGSLFALHDDALDISAGSPQFEDRYVYILGASSVTRDTEGGGTSDGAGAASRVGAQNHFELRHPLCSGDSLDFCLHPGDTVGFRLEYLDAEGDGSFGGSRFYPGFAETSEADIVIGQCSTPDFSDYLPLINR